MQVDTLLGSIMIWPLDWVPEGYHLCDGSLLSVRDNQALASILGNKYGGDGINNFALPDLRGRVVVGYGQGNGLSPHPIASVGGTETVALNPSQIPSHSHSLMASTLPATQSDPTGNILANSGGGTDPTTQLPLPGSPVHIDPPSSTTPLVPTNIANIGSAGGGLAHSNMQPYTTLNFIIAVGGGIYPLRND
jgi:microcystin-dependent protein